MFPKTKGNILLEIVLGGNSFHHYEKKTKNGWDWNVFSSVLLKPMLKRNNKVLFVNYIYCININYQWAIHCCSIY